jgi:hypothetical protein
MAIQQRAKGAKAWGVPSAELWAPWGSAPEDARGPVPSPRPSDRYVTVDEQVEQTIGLVTTRWPTIDDFGLRFDDRISDAWFDASALQHAVDKFRQRTREVLRPLRIGDTFWVRGFSATSLDNWKDSRDVTSQAREMTKLAAAVAVLGPAPLSEVHETFAVKYAPRTVPAIPVTQAAQTPGGAATARPTI